MDYLQKWWEEKYPNAGVKNIINVSEGIITTKDLISFHKWLFENLQDNTTLQTELDNLKINNTDYINSIHEKNKIILEKEDENTSLKQHLLGSKKDADFWFRKMNDYHPDETRKILDSEEWRLLYK